VLYTWTYLQRHQTHLLLTALFTPHSTHR